MTRTCGLNAGPQVLGPTGSVWSHPRGGYAAMGIRGCLGARLLQGRSHDVRSRLQSPRLGRRLRGEMTTVLITQCLQRDFVDPIGPHDPLPNLLHVGYSESTRLLGPEPAAGPLAQLIEWARGLSSDAMDLVHIRDWHDANDPAQREHLVRFGAHCIKGTIGARLVLEMDEWAEAAPNECIVDSITLNDLEGTDLEEQLDRIRREHGGGPVRVGRSEERRVGKECRARWSPYH